MTPKERAKKLLRDHESDFMECHTHDHFDRMARLIAECIEEAIRDMAPPTNS